MIKFKLIKIPFVLIALTACKKDKTLSPLVCDIKISYSNDIVPIIQGSCMTGLGAGTGCHDAWITQYSNIVPTIVSNRWQNVIWESYSMPKTPNTFGIQSLTVDEIQIMKCWVDQGYPEN